MQKYKFEGTEYIKITVKVEGNSNKMNGEMHRIPNLYLIVMFCINTNFFLLNFRKVHNTLNSLKITI